MRTKEESYIIDSIRYPDGWKYIEEAGVTDTRLAVIPSDSGKDLVLRPPSIPENRRLTIGTDYLGVVKNFNNLTNELETFGFKVPPYCFFVSDIHTKEGSKGEGLCLTSEYIIGRCLPLDYKDCWKGEEENFYVQMDRWLTNITKHSICKYLSAEEETLFLADIFRPIQFAYSCREDSIYLVDLDPFFAKIFNDDGTLNKRFLIGIQTINNQRNYLKNRMVGDGLKSKDFGAKAEKMLKDLLEETDFIKDSIYSTETERIMSNLKQRLYYRRCK